MDVVRKNGVSVEGQLSLYEDLVRDIASPEWQNIIWSNLPKYEQMRYVLEVAAKNNILTVVEILLPP